MQTANKVCFKTKRVSVRKMNAAREMTLKNDAKISFFGKRGGNHAKNIV